MITDPRDKVAVITGGASGIGLAHAKRFLDAGMRVVISDINPESLDTAVAELDAGDRLHAVNSDASDLDANIALAAEAEERFGGVNVAHLNAALLGEVGGWGASDITIEAWRVNMSVSLNGPFYGMKAFLPLLEKQEQAHVIFTASSFSLIPSLGDPAPYFVAKAGLLALAECLYHDLDSKGSHIGVTAVLPGNTYNGLYYQLVDLLAASEEDPSVWDDTVFGPRETVKPLIEHFAETGTGPEILAEDTLEAIQTGRFYVTPNIGEHWKYIEARFENIRTGNNPDLLDKSASVWLPH